MRFVNRARHRSGVTCLAAAVVAIVVAACGGSSSSTTTSATTAATAAGTSAAAGTTAAAGGDVASQIEAAQEKCRGEADPLASKFTDPQLQEWLRGTQLVPILESPWGNGGATPRAKQGTPWKIGFSNSFAGNDARQDVIRAMRDQTAAYNKSGLVGDLVETLSDGDVAKHNNQINQLVQQGVDGIIDLSPGKDATTRSIDAAGKAGVPVVTMDSPVVSQYAVNATTANYLQSVDSSGWMIGKLGGKGTIVTVQGIKGEPGSEIWEQGAACVFEQFPDVKILANIYGSWTEPVAKTEMQKVLTTNPGATIDAVWVQGPGTTGVIQAFEQTGRPMPKMMTNFGQKAVLAYWRDNRDAVSMYSSSQPPYESTVEAYQVLIRILSGQKPILNAVYNLGPAITDDTLDQWVKPEDKWPDSRGFASISQDTWMSQDTMNGYFSNGAPVLP
jgi:ribose transport system substrate-binding protein